MLSVSVPQSGFRSFNVGICRPTLVSSELSVSTIGSFIVQHGHGDGDCRSVCFQYPQSDRSSFNSRAILSACAANIFQYPQSDRSSFNLSAAAALGRRFAFSIHNRIVHRSTAWGNRSWAGCSTFSIHNRIVHRSTATSSRGRKAAWWLSVSTIGSFIVQRGGVCGWGNYRVFQYPQSDRSSFNSPKFQGVPIAWSVSVSTIGSFIVQPLGVTNTPALLSFQYPQSDRSSFNLNRQKANR
mgnify:FL=1